MRTKISLLVIAVWLLPFLADAQDPIAPQANIEKVAGECKLTFRAQLKPLVDRTTLLAWVGPCAEGFAHGRGIFFVQVKNNSGAPSRQVQHSIAEKGALREIGSGSYVGQGKNLYKSESGKLSPIKATELPEWAGFVIATGDLNFTQMQKAREFLSQTPDIAQGPTPAAQSSNQAAPSSVSSPSQVANTLALSDADCISLLKNERQTYGQRSPQFASRFFNLRPPKGSTTTCEDCQAVGLRLAAWLTQPIVVPGSVSGYPTGCVGFRTDIQGSRQGAECLVKFLGAGYFVSPVGPNSCSADGYPYTIIPSGKTVTNSGVSAIATGTSTAPSAAKTGSFTFTPQVGMPGVFTIPELGGGFLGSD